ncbi:MAG: hypothetical protein RRZ64_07800 [Rikenellaceae bacterium]
MKTYLLRALKYLCYFVILFALVYALLSLAGYNEMQDYSFIEVMTSNRGIMMCCVIIALSLVYPLISTTKKVIFNMPMSEVVEAMKTVGYHEVEREGDEVAFFRADKFSDRLFMKMDDGVRVYIIGDQTVFDGSRRAIVKTAYTIEMKRR